MAQRILVADDDSHSRDLITTILSVHGYEVTATCDGLEAQDEILSNPPDLAILDIQMPGLTGTELCQSIKTNLDVSYVPVMLLSACTDTAQRAQQCGADDYLLKPYSITNLCEKVVQLLVSQPLAVA